MKSRKKNMLHISMVIITDVFIFDISRERKKRERQTKNECAHESNRFVSVPCYTLNGLCLISLLFL